MKDEIISAFAYNTAKEIENIIINRTNVILEENQFLQAKILNWYQQTRDEKFKEYFNITELKEGHIWQTNY
jgi:hypothetical protein